MENDTTLATESSKSQPPATETSIRVHVQLLDSLMTLAGELVLSRNQLLQTIGTNEQRNIEAVGQRIDMITSELQEAIMLTRMQPIDNVFSKFPRVIRDLATKLGKQVNLEIYGKEVDLDKTIIEAIGDPLTHLIRNAVDHGIELPNDRLKHGKDPIGQVVLRAFHEAGQVGIEISDDGKGLDGNLLGEIAVSKGLLSHEYVQGLSMTEKINLIFLPGFSMAAEVTDVSGRGVGMDVVKTNLDKLGGNIEIISDLGKGTTISIKLPLTLAIIPCQIIVTGEERYAIPQVNLEELLRIPASHVKERIECVGDAQVVRLRGKLLPLIRLADVIGIERTYVDHSQGENKPDRRQLIADRRGKAFPTNNDETAPDQPSCESGTINHDSRTSVDRRTSPTSALNIVVVSTGTMKYGLIVDQLQDSEEIVIKPLGIHLHKCIGYAGATIMGDGRIALILDVGNLAKMAQLNSVENTDRASEVAINAQEALEVQNSQQSLLIFRSSEQEQFAVKLDQVERIEKIKSSQLENLGNKKVMQYREGTLPLICMDDVAMVQPLADREDILVIVFNYDSKAVGLLAIGPIDAISSNVEIDTITLQQKGIEGSSIINGETTMVVNVTELIKASFPEWEAVEAS